MDPQDALFQASKRGENDDLEELLKGDYKVDVNSVDDLENCALHYAAAADHTKAVSLLLGHGASVDKPNRVGETALHKAAARNALRTCKYLVNNGAKLDIRQPSRNMS